MSALHFTDGLQCRLWLIYASWNIFQKAKSEKWCLINRHTGEVGTMVQMAHLEKQSTEELVKAFALAAQEQGQALKDGNPGKANRRTTLIDRTFAELKKRGPEAWVEFLFLLSHSEPYVRYFAAVYALRSNPNAAIPVLERLDEQERGLLAFRAAQALRQWRKGEWILP